jgi:hypothetical protein
VRNVEIAHCLAQPPCQHRGLAAINAGKQHRELFTAATSNGFAGPSRGTNGAAARNTAVETTTTTSACRRCAGPAGMVDRKTWSSCAGSSSMDPSDAMVYVHLAQRGRYWIVIDPPGSINRTQSPVPTQTDVARITPLPHFQAKNGLPGRLYPTQEGIARASTEGNGS